jgi:hypothetical protein
MCYIILEINDLTIDELKINNLKQNDKIFIS